MIYCDTHVHSWRSFVGAPNMKLMNIANMAETQGINVVAITDHLMKSDDIKGLKLTKHDIEVFNSSLESNVRILFGVEVCEVDNTGQTLLTKELVDDLEFDLIIGGVHNTHIKMGSSLQEMVVRQHQHHIMMINNPYIEVLVHPWWLDKDEFSRFGIDWPFDMSFIPKELTIELARASNQTGTYIEISTMSGLCNKDTSDRFHLDLLDYYKLLNDEGALFTIGTDAHEVSEIGTYSLAKQLIKQVGIDESRFYLPKERK